MPLVVAWVNRLTYSSPSPPSPHHQLFASLRYRKRCGGAWSLAVYAILFTVVLQPTPQSRYKLTSRQRLCMQNLVECNRQLTSCQRYLLISLYSAVNLISLSYSHLVNITLLLASFSLDKKVLTLHNTGCQ